MNRIILLFIILLVARQVLFAQSDTTIVLNDLVFSGNRIATPFSEASRNIQIISKEQIIRSPAQSLPEILSYTPGVDIRQRGPVGVQSDIGIRGGTFEQTLILLNGIKLTDPQTGHHIMNLPVPLDNIQQIEVLKGPGARIYGQNAFAGAVNFVTKTPDARKLGFRTYGGSFGSFGGNISLSLPSENAGTYMSFSADRSDGYRHNTDYKIVQGFLQHDYRLKTGEINFILGLSDRKFGANGFYASPNFTEQYEEVRTSITSIGYKADFGKFTIKPRVYWRNNRDKYLFIRENPAAYQNLHETSTYGIEVNSSYSGQLGLTGFGFEYRKEEINGDWVRGGTWTKSNLDGFFRDNVGFFADQRLKLLNTFDITPGLYINWYSDFGWNAFPGMDVGFNVNNRIRVYGNIGKSFRIPTFYDQYYSSPVEQGNPDLKPEEALTYEIGIRYIHNGFSMEANYFVRDADNLIDWVYDTGDSIWRSQNFQSVKTNGLELSAGINFDEWIDPAFPLDFLGLSYNFLNQNINQAENVQSRYALEHIRHQIIGSVDFTIYRRLKNSLRMRYIDRFEQEPYFLMDNRLFYQENAYMIFIEATNLTNQSYTEVMTPMPGRWVRGGVSFQVGF